MLIFVAAFPTHDSIGSDEVTHSLLMEMEKKEA